MAKDTEQEVEYLPPPEFQTKSPLEYSKIKPGGIGTDPAVTERLEKANKAVEDYAAALEQRFAQPNWFRIAAGFAKPQLGGFLASLGSASEEFGRQQEAQRAIAPSIAKMRAEVESGKLTFEQRMAQKRMWDDMTSGKIPINADTINKLGEFGTDTDIFKTAREYFTQKQAQQQVISGDVDLQKAVLANPALIIDDPAYTGRARRTPEESQQFTAKVVAARPDYIKPADWTAMTFPQKLDIIAEYNNKKITAGMSEGDKFAFEAGQAHNILDELAALRKLAVDKDLAPMFGVGTEGDLFSQFRALMQEKGGNAAAVVDGMVAAARNKLKNVDDVTRAKADKLIKGIKELEVNMRGTVINPTDAASTLSSSRSPSLENSQAGFVGILDQLGLNAYRTIGLGKLHNQLGKEGVTAKDAAYDKAMEKFREDTRKLRLELASKYSLDQTSIPAWYSTREQTREREEPAVAPASAPAVVPTAPAAPAATSTQGSKPAATSKPGSKPAAATGSNERVFGDKTYIRQANGSYKLKE